MEVHNLKDIYEAITQTREEFRKTIDPINGIIEEPVNLYFEIMILMKAVAKDTDDDRYTLEVLATTFRRIIGSFVLLESGLAQEAHIILRNALELMLIGIDIAYNKTSIEEWKKTIGEELKTADYEDWYFKKSKMCKRIEENQDNIYPELERKLALGVDGVAGNGICKEWKIISNMSVHAHSQAQIRKLFDEKGNFRLLGRKKIEDYTNDLSQYRIFIMNIITILIGLPRYREIIIKSEHLKAQANLVAQAYSKLQKEAGSAIFE